MMRVLASIFLALICFPGLTHASDQYQLRSLTMDEYLVEILPIMEIAYRDGDDFVVRRIIVQEFNLRYPIELLFHQPFERLTDFQEMVAIGADPFLPLDLGAWFTAMLESGFRDHNQLDFSAPFTLGNFEITSTTVDFNGDGVSEPLLDVYDGFSGRRFYALVTEQIQVAPLPIIGMDSSHVTRGNSATSNLTTRALADLDGDGGTEWIVSGNAYGYWASCYDLYVIDWSDGRLINRAGRPFTTCESMAQAGSVTFNLDNARALQMIVTNTDGWNCERVRTITLNLIQDTIDNRLMDAQTVWCQIGRAARAFDRQDYDSAIQLYTHALLTLSGEIEQYVLARLALSYALNGQMDVAQAILTSVEPRGQMGVLLLRIRAVPEEPEAMCRMAYEFFRDMNRTATNQYDNPYPWTAPNFYFGYNPLDPRYVPLPYPEQAGCNHPALFVEEPEAAEPWSFPPDIDDFVTWSAYNRLQEGNYELVLSQLDTMITRVLSEPDKAYLLTRLLFWRAITLELMGRSEEALRQYVAIYRLQPENAWGLLARLHFEEAK